MATRTTAMDEHRIATLIESLLEQPSETAWLEFKENDSNPKSIGKYISALSNATRLEDKPFAYMLWGIRDTDHGITGTTFSATSARHKGQPLEHWLTQFVSPSLNFTFRSVDYHGIHLTLLEIPACESMSTEFDRIAYIRIGSATPKLSDHSGKLKALWGKIQSHAWESGTALAFIDTERVLDILDYPEYFRQTAQPTPDGKYRILEKLHADGLVQRDAGDNWNITNLGAILYARELKNFPPPIQRKSIRFIAYDGNGRMSPVRYRMEGSRGYATDFPAFIDRIHDAMQHHERIDRVRRVSQYSFPEIAIRELVANALIHQDMTIRGSGPLVEMFNDRIEVTNPGVPLIIPERFLDFPPRSRNEALAALMRRMRYCEEQGTGIDKVIQAVESHHLPAPDFRTEGDAVRIVLYGPRKFADMTPEERIRACYQHAAFLHVNGKRMKNASLRERLGIDLRNAAQASSVISQTLKADLIRSADPAHPRAGYLPYWA